MGWTLMTIPGVGTIATIAGWATKVVNNFRYLKGLDGVPTIESGLIIDNAGGDEYLQIPSLTTTERDLLTPVNGMIIYNETTTEFNKYEAGAWVDLADNTDHGGLDGLADDDHSAYQNKNLLTTQGDIIYATSASTWVRLAKGTASQVLRMNAGATAPEWGTPDNFGTQSDVTATRVIGTVYQNTSGGNMMVTVSVSCTQASGAVIDSAGAYTDSSTPPTTLVAKVGHTTTNTSATNETVFSMTFIVISNNYYKVASIDGTAVKVSWIEWTV